MQASVKGNPKPVGKQQLETSQLIKMENMLKSKVKEISDLASVASEGLNNEQRKDMLKCLNLGEPDCYAISKNRIVRK